MQVPKKLIEKLNKRYNDQDSMFSLIGVTHEVYNYSVSAKISGDLIILVMKEPEYADYVNIFDNEKDYLRYIKTYCKKIKNEFQESQMILEDINKRICFDYELYSENATNVKINKVDDFVTYYKIKVKDLLIYTIEDEEDAEDVDFTYGDISVDESKIQREIIKFR